MSSTQAEPPKTVTPAPVVRFLRPFQQFASSQAAGGLLLLACALLALGWENSSWSSSYEALWHTKLQVGLAGYTLNGDLHFWVNDLLMVLFFFVVGLEIKREMLVGELASPRKAALPILAAIGGVIVPAGIYYLVNRGTPTSHGWGIPMATDIAFALGALVLLGDRIPGNLKVFLAALAIVDDIAAVIVIAVFYTPHIHKTELLLAAGLVAALFILNRVGVRHALPYALLGLCLWLAVLRSGVHATIAGVLLAFTIPVRTTLDGGQFLERCEQILRRFERARSKFDNLLSNERQQSAIAALEDACERVQPPLHRLQHALHPWVNFVIMPLFALANAGIPLTGDVLSKYSQPVTLGVLLGLLVGKPVGVTLASWLAVRSHAASLPPGVSFHHIHGAAWLAGIGFTMSLFVAGLSFREETFLTMAKLGVLSASLCAGLIGSAILMTARRRHEKAQNRPRPAASA